MTTVSWDGKTLAVDSRITMLNRIDPKGRPDHLDNMPKMEQPKGADVHGHEVKVMTFAGSYDLALEIFNSIEYGNLNKDAVATLDLADVAFYKQFPKLLNTNAHTQLLCIMDDFTASISVTVKDGKISITVFKYALTEVLLMGSGRDALQKKITLPLVSSMPARVVVTVAGWYDAGTGGTTSVWDKETNTMQEYLPFNKGRAYIRRTCARTVISVLGAVCRVADFVRIKTKARYTERRQERINAGVL